jgi:hypothetical protein
MLSEVTRAKRGFGIRHNVRNSAAIRDSARTHYDWHSREWCNSSLLAPRDSAMFPSKLQLIIAFALAPLAPVMLGFVVAEFKLLALLVGFLLAYTASIFIGLPLYVLIRRFFDLAANVCIVGGMLSGGLLWVVIMIPALIEYPSLKIGAMVLGGTFVYAFFGAVAGFAFWKLLIIGSFAQSSLARSSSTPKPNRLA